MELRPHPLPAAAPGTLPVGARQDPQEETAPRDPRRQPRLPPPPPPPHDDLRPLPRRQTDPPQPLQRLPDPLETPLRHGSDPGCLPPPGAGQTPERGALPPPPHPEEDLQTEVRTCNTQDETVQNYRLRPPEEATALDLEVRGGRERGHSEEEARPLAPVLLRVVPRGREEARVFRVVLLWPAGVSRGPWFGEGGRPSVGRVGATATGEVEENFGSLGSSEENFGSLRWSEEDFNSLRWSEEDFTSLGSI